MSSHWDPPVVVRMRDDVTGSMSVVPVEEIETVLAVWFPLLTPAARQTVADLRMAVARGDWEGVRDHACSLGLRIERFRAHGWLPSPRHPVDEPKDWEGGDRA